MSQEDPNLLRDFILELHTMNNPESWNRHNLRVRLWDTQGIGKYGKLVLRYELAWQGGPQDGRIIFAGEDLHVPTYHAVDADENVNALLGFFSDDTDAEGWNDEQHEFVETFGDQLSMINEERYGSYPEHPYPGHGWAEKNEAELEWLQCHLFKDLTSPILKDALCFWEEHDSYRFRYDPSVINEEIQNTAPNSMTFEED